MGATVRVHVFSVLAMHSSLGAQVDANQTTLRHGKGLQTHTRTRCTQHTRADVDPRVRPPAHTPPARPQRNPHTMCPGARATHPLPLAASMSQYDDADTGISFAARFASIVTTLSKHMPVQAVPAWW